MLAFSPKTESQVGATYVGHCWSWYAKTSGRLLQICDNKVRDRATLGVGLISNPNGNKHLNSRVRHVCYSKEGCLGSSPEFESAKVNGEDSFVVVRLGARRRTWEIGALESPPKNQAPAARLRR